MSEDAESDFLLFSKRSTDSSNVRCKGLCPDLSETTTPTDSIYLKCSPKENIALENRNNSKSLTENNPQPKSASFEGLNIAPWLCATLRSLAIETPTAVQRALIPALLSGRDAVACSPTGSGKTAAYVLPIVQQLANDPFGVFALVLAPGRELAFQIAEAFAAVGVGVGLRVCTVVGGVDAVQQAASLARQPHVVVATPGRLCDVLKRGGVVVALRRLRFVVVDEADRLLAEGTSLAAETSAILAAIHEAVGSRSESLQTVVVSATNAHIAARSAALRLRIDCVETFDAANQTASPSILSTVASCSQRFVLVPSAVKSAYLAWLLLNDFRETGGVVFVFVSRCNVCAFVAHMLAALDADFGEKVVALHSQLGQRARLEAVARVKSGDARVCVTTDLGSRGLDVPEAKIVVIYDVPNAASDYVHRVGRVGRAARNGMAISLVTERDISLLQNIEARIGLQLEEYAVEERSVLSILDSVAAAKRHAAMRLHETDFGAKRRAHADKQRKSASLPA